MYSEAFSACIYAESGVCKLTRKKKHIFLVSVFIQKHMYVIDQEEK